ncbi:MAG: WG repeat-containing protein [Gammaproteobacteria bacterium]|nr:WG repeat-containing protein [Gammaproteobacteria bacterium]
MNRKTHLTIIIFSLFIILKGKSLAASFDCNLATSNVEITICKDPSLNKLDTSLGEAYKATKSSISEDKLKSLIETQRQWIKKRNDECSTDLKCLEKSITDRINELTSLKVTINNPKFILLKEVEQLGTFDSGYATVKTNEGWGVVDKNGNFKVNPSYTEAKGTKNGYIPVKVDENWKILDIEKDKYIDVKDSDNTSRIEKGVIWLQYGEKWSLFSIEKSQFIINDALKFTDIGPNGDTLFYKDNHWFYNNIYEIGVHLKAAFLDDAQMVYGFKGRYAAYKDITGKFGLIDNFGELAAEGLYDFFLPKPNEKGTILGPGGVWYYFSDADDIKEFPSIDANIELVKDSTQGLFPAKMNGKWGYIDISGKWVIEPTFDIAYNFSESVAIARNGNARKLIDTKGKYLTNYDFEDAWKNQEGLSPVKYLGDWYIYNNNIEIAVDMNEEVKIDDPKISWAKKFKNHNYDMKNGIYTANYIGHRCLINVKTSDELDLVLTRAYIGKTGLVLTGSAPTIENILEPYCYIFDAITNNNSTSKIEITTLLNESLETYIFQVSTENCKFTVIYHDFLNLEVLRSTISSTEFGNRCHSFGFRGQRLFEKDKSSTYLSPALSTIHNSDQYLIDNFTTNYYSITPWWPGISIEIKGFEQFSNNLLTWETVSMPKLTSCSIEIQHQEQALDEYAETFYTSTMSLEIPFTGDIYISSSEAFDKSDDIFNIFDNISKYVSPSTIEHAPKFPQYLFSRKYTYYLFFKGKDITGSKCDNYRGSNRKCHDIHILLDGTETDEVFESVGYFTKENAVEIDHVLNERQKICSALHDGF